jgi:hypothetical protein
MGHAQRPANLTEHVIMKTNRHHPRTYKIRNLIAAGAAAASLAAGTAQAAKPARLINGMLIQPQRPERPINGIFINPGKIHRPINGMLVNPNKPKRPVNGLFVGRRKPV